MPRRCGHLRGLRGASRLGLMAELDIALIAELLDTAARARICVHPFARRNCIDESGAYAIQRSLIARRLARGEELVGVKLGFTSEAMRRQMNINTANIGFLTDVMLFHSGQAVPASRFIHPRVEPEVALRLGRDVSVPIDRETVDQYVDACAPAIEIVDSRFYDYRFTLEDNTSDNSSAAACVLGEWRAWPFELGGLATSLMIDGAVHEEGSTAAAMGHPLNALLEAIRLTSEQNRSLRAGTILITGGLTTAPFVRAGQRVEANIAGLGHAHFSLV